MKTPWIAKLGRIIVIESYFYVNYSKTLHFLFFVGDLLLHEAQDEYQRLFNAHVTIHGVDGDKGLVQ